MFHPNIPLIIHGHGLDAAVHGRGDCEKAGFNVAAQEAMPQRAGAMNREAKMMLALLTRKHHWKFIKPLVSLTESV